MFHHNSSKTSFEFSHPWPSKAPTWPDPQERLIATLEVEPYVGPVRKPLEATSSWVVDAGDLKQCTFLF